MLKVSRQTIDVIEKKDSVTVSDILGLFRDVFDDISKEQGTGFANLPTGDAADAAKYTILVMNNMRKLHNKNNDIFSEARYKERWEDANRGLDEAQKKLERINQVEEACLRTEKRTGEIKAQTAKLRSRVEAIKHENEQATEEWHRFETEIKKQEALLADSKRQRDEILKERMPAAIRELEEVNRNLQEAQAKNDVLCEQLKNEKELLEAEKKRLKEQAEKKVEALQETQRKWELESQAANKRLADVDKQIHAMEEEVSSVKSRITGEEELLREKTKEHEEQKELLSQTKAKTEDIIMRIMELQKEVKEAEEQCSLQKQKLEELCKTGDEMSQNLDQTWQVWEMIWSAFQQEKGAFSGNDNMDDAAAEAMERQYQQIRQDVENFRKSYAQVVSMLR